MALRGLRNQAAPGAGATEKIYTAPSDIRFGILTWSASNRSGVADAITVRRAIRGAAAANGDSWVFGKALAGNASDNDQNFKRIALPGDEVRVSSANGTVDFEVNVLEFTET